MSRMSVCMYVCCVHLNRIDFFALNCNLTSTYVRLLYLIDLKPIENERSQLDDKFDLVK